MSVARLSTRFASAASSAPPSYRMRCRATRPAGVASSGWVRCGASAQQHRLRYAALALQWSVGGSAYEAATYATSGSAAVASTDLESRDFFANDSRPIILFDGVCNMCSGGVTFCLDWDKKGVMRFAALQSDVGRTLLQRNGRAPDDISSIVLVDRNRAYIKSEAILRIGQQLEMPLPILTTLVFPLPLFFRDTVYDFIASNRYLVFGRTESCRLSDERFADRFVS